MLLVHKHIFLTTLLYSLFCDSDSAPHFISPLDDKVSGGRTQAVCVYILHLTHPKILENENLPVLIQCSGYYVLGSNIMTSKASLYNLCNLYHLKIFRRLLVLKCGVLNFLPYFTFSEMVPPNTESYTNLQNYIFHEIRRQQRLQIVTYVEKQIKGGESERLVSQSCLTLQSVDCSPLSMEVSRQEYWSG